MYIYVYLLYIEVSRTICHSFHFSRLDPFWIKFIFERAWEPHLNHDEFETKVCKTIAIYSFIYEIRRATQKRKFNTAFRVQRTSTTTLVYHTHLSMVIWYVASHRGIQIYTHTQPYKYFWVKIINLNLMGFVVWNRFKFFRNDDNKDDNVNDKCHQIFLVPIRIPIPIHSTLTAPNVWCTNK